MTDTLDIGFVALTDAAPIIVAQELGFFREADLDVRLHREVSWATIRDKVAAGVHNAAHMHAPMVVAANAGIGSAPARIAAPLSLNANSAALGVSAELAELMQSASPNTPATAAAFADAIRRRRGMGKPVASFGVVFPYSLHTFMLRNWMASGGLVLETDLRIVIAPPTAIAARLQAGEIDGFCVGAPWGALCEGEAGARIVLSAQDFLPGAPDKVLGLSQAWADTEPDAALGLVKAVIRAGVWCDDPGNVETLAQLLSGRDYVAAPKDLISTGLQENGRRIRFSSGGAGCPAPSHAEWILSEMRKWGQLGANADLEAALACYRPDLYRDAAASLGLK